MKMRAHRWLISTCLAGLLVPGFSGAMQTAPAITQTDSWVTFAPPDEEFTAVIPGRPIARTYPIYRQRDSQQERTLAHHEYGGFGSGLIFVIHSFKAERPERLSGSMPGLVDERAVFERISIDGTPAELFRGTATNRVASYTKRTLRFTTAKHLYIVALMSLEENDPAVDRFLSSLRLRRPEDQVTPLESPLVAAAGGVLNANEVTRRAIIVWKSEPRYTDEARAHKVTGNVTLDAVFGDDGYVSDVTVIKGLEHGLTESAIEAARSIRFFPAQKDGKAVSQRLMLEYNFNLY